MPPLPDPPPLADRSAGWLAEQIAAGSLTSAAAVEALIARCEASGAASAALSQPRFDAARREAAAIDAGGVPTAGGARPPLLGVPVSIKDCFAVAGLETTLGLPARRGVKDAADSPLVRRLRRAGAVVLGKTNVPQAMLLHECDNPVFGRCTLPGRQDRSPGGSSGGEAALVAAGGSPLGLGSDLGGSIRQPAASCGVAGFMPSPGVLTAAGSQRALSPGMRAICVRPGPLARTVEDLRLAMRVLAGSSSGDRQADETCPPWRAPAPVEPTALRIAWWADDGVFRPATAIAAAVQRAASRLQAAGATVVHAPPPAAARMMGLYLGIVSADGMRAVRGAVRGGAVESQLARQLWLARLPRWSRRVLAPTLRLAGQPDLADLLGWSGPRSADAYWRLVASAETYRRRFWETLAAACGGPVHATLSPAHGLPALRHGTALHVLRAASHTFLANLIGCPAGVVPAGRVTAEQEQAELAARAASRGRLAYFARQNARGSTGLPVGVQVMAPPGRDAVVLDVMQWLAPATEPPVSSACGVGA